MAGLGQFIDVHVTRAQKVVALIVGAITLVTAIVGGAVWVSRKLADSERPPELSWAPGVETRSDGNTWSPDRRTYTADSPPDIAKLNSITDQPAYGDERNFFRVRNASAGTDWSDSVELKRKDEFEASVYFHNDSDAKDQQANYAYARVEIPAIVPRDEDSTNNFALAHVGASNVQPSVVTDSVSFINNDEGDFALRYVPGTAHIISDSHIDEATVNADLLFHMSGPRDGGTPLGSADGVLPPGTEGRLVFRFVAVQPDFGFETLVRLYGSKEWKHDLTVQPGDRIQLQLAYENTGDTQQDDVVMKASWPHGLDYLHGQTRLWNAMNPDGKVLDDSMESGGVNIGNYADDTNAYLDVEAIVSAPPCSVLDFPASVETDNGDRLAHATVRVAGANCPTP